MDFKEGELVLKDPMFFCFRFVGSIELEIGRRLYMQQLRANESHGCDKHCHEMESSDEEESTQQCTSGSPKTKVPLPEDVVKSLMNGQLVLPFSEKSPCCQLFHALVDVEKLTIAEADWESSHSLLCTETNDIFLLAAKYHNLKAVSLEKQMKHHTSYVSNHCNLSILLEAWKPILMGHKRRWWDCIALPNDVDSSDEASFRLQIKMLAFEVRFFRMHRRSCILADVDFVMFIMWIPIFSLEIYGNIIGMFELNNL
uniref:Uncharacterized protein n=1 Tax=Glycine max TaxID=3847 RepID=A0A0R0FDD0_SOYBN